LGEVQAGRRRCRGATLAALFGALTLVFAGSAGAFHSKNPSLPPLGTGSPPGFLGTNYRGFDPMEVSIPYLAWRGEEVRLVKCFSRERLVLNTGRNLNNPLAAAEWQIMDWSGDAHVWPKFYDDLDQRTNRFQGQGDQSGRDCFAIDITSHKPGIAIVKLSVDADDFGLTDTSFEEGLLEQAENDPSQRNENLDGEGDPVAKHQFVVIWMTLRQPILRCLAATTDVTPSGCPGAGPITENPLDTNRLGVVVKGDVPLNEEFRTELGRQDTTDAIDPATSTSIVLPDAWDDLAGTTLNSISMGLRLANDGNPANDPVNPAGPEPNHTTDQVFDEFWDIHDSTGPFNTNVYGPDQPNTVAEICPGAIGTPAAHAACHVSQAPVSGDVDCNGTSTTTDTVDNCDPGEFSAFSRVFHDVSGPPTIGPYAPTRPDETILSDSTTNIHDAPMPSALVKAGIAPGPGPSPGISGVGFLTGVDKHSVYNRCAGGSQAVHCLTGPFYGAYIPPSPTMENNPAELPASLGGNDDPDTASGIHGTFANDFDGYLPVSYDPDGPGGIAPNRGLYHYWDVIETRRLAVGGTLPAECVAQGFQPVSGPQEIVLYTDEHGEAQFLFNAGLGLQPGAFVVDPFQEACVARGLIGLADISVQARYPFQPTTHLGETSNVLTKRILSLFEKGIICVPKPNEEDDKALCIVFARDFAGRPATNEVVCVNFEGGIEGGINDLERDPANGDIEPARDRKICIDLEEEGTNDAIETLLPGPHAGPRCPAPTDDLDEFASDVLLVDLQGGPIEATAHFVDENVEFDCVFSIPAPGTPPGTPAPAVSGAGSNGNGNADVNGTSSSGSVVLPGGKTLADGVVVNGGPRANGSPGGDARVSGGGGGGGSFVNGAKALPRTAIVFIRIVKPLKQGAARSVILRVKSSKKTERITLRLIGPRGKVLGTVLRTVKTNRTVRVPNLRVPTSVKNVRVKLIA
jgi:hypothetical protein